MLQVESRRGYVTRKLRHGNQRPSIRLAVLMLVVCVSTMAVWQTVAAGRKVSNEDVSRARYVAAIEKKWGPLIRRSYGMAPSEWTGKMLGTFTASDLANMRRAASARTFDGMSGALFGGSSRENMALARPQSIDSTENDLVFTPLPPCRILDTRVIGGPVAAGTSRPFQGWTSNDFMTQGGSATNCGVPENASAMVTNVVVVQPVTQIGYLTLYPSGTSRPLTATVNFIGAGKNIGNQVILKLCRPGCADQFNVFTTSQTQVVADVSGYYMEPVATALDCTTATTAPPPLNLGLIDVTASCPSGYAATGGGCGGPLGVNVGGSRAAMDGSGKPTGWKCSLASSLVIGLAGGRADATCCRILRSTSAGLRRPVCWEKPLSQRARQRRGVWKRCAGPKVRSRTSGLFIGR